jgi:multiple sugar transport system permease protein
MGARAVAGERVFGEARARRAVAGRGWRRLPRLVAVYGAALLLAAWSLVPLYWLVNLSLMHKDEILSIPGHLYPQQPTISNFLLIFDFPAYGPDGAQLALLGQSSLILHGLRNSFLTAVPVTLLTTLISIPIAYAVGRLQFRHKTLLVVCLLSARSYPPIATIIPYSAMFFTLGMQRTLHGLMLVYLTATIPLVAWVMSGVFASLPRTLEAAARVDGLTRFGALWYVVVPVAMPGVAACAVVSFLICWNEFTFSYVLTAGAPWAQTYPPLLPGLMFMQGNTSVFAAVSIIGLLPPLVLAALFQRRISGLNIVNPIT